MRASIILQHKIETIIVFGGLMWFQEENKKHPFFYFLVMTYRPLVGSFKGNRTSSLSLAKTTEFNPESIVPTSADVNSANS
jgi:hypothetical protein